MPSLNVPVVTTVLTAASRTNLVTLDEVKSDWAISGTTDDVFVGRLIKRVSGAVGQYCNRTFAVQTVRDDFINGMQYWPNLYYDSRSPLRTTVWPIISVTSVTEGTNSPTTLTTDDYAVSKESGGLIRLDGNGLPMLWPVTKISATYKAGYALPWTYTASTITFSSSAPEITDSASGFSGLQAGDLIDTSGSTAPANNGRFLVDTAANGALVLKNPDGTAPSITSSTAGSAITIDAVTTLPDDLRDAVSRMVWVRYSERTRDPFVVRKRDEIVDVRRTDVQYLTPTADGNMPPDVADLLDNYRVPVL